MPRRRVAALDGPAQRAFAGIRGAADTENFGLKWRRRLRLRKGRQTQECDYRTTADEDRRHGGPLASFAAHIAIPSQSMNAQEWFFVAKKRQQGRAAKGVLTPRNPMVGSFAGSCARAASGPAAPPNVALNSRRPVWVAT